MNIKYKVITSNTPVYAKINNVLTIVSHKNIGDEFYGTPFNTVIVVNGNKRDVSGIKINGAANNTFVESINVQRVSGERRVEANSSFTPDAKTKAEKMANVAWIVGSLGFIAGLIYAFKTKKSFWGYVGYSFLGSTVLGTLGAVGGAIFIPKDSSNFSGGKKNTTDISKTIKEVDFMGGKRNVDDGLNHGHTIKELNFMGQRESPTKLIKGDGKLIKSDANFVGNPKQERGVKITLEGLPEGKVIMEKTISAKQLNLNSTNS